MIEIHDPDMRTRIRHVEIRIDRWTATSLADALAKALRTEEPSEVHLSSEAATRGEPSVLTFRITD